MKTTYEFPPEIGEYTYVQVLNTKTTKVFFFYDDSPRRLGLMVKKILHSNSELRVIGKSGDVAEWLR